MYDMLRALNRELDSGIESSFSNELLRKELDDLYTKISRYKTAQTEQSLQELLRRLDSALDDESAAGGGGSWAGAMGGISGAGAAGAAGGSGGNSDGTSPTNEISFDDKFSPTNEISRGISRSHKSAARSSVGQGEKHAILDDFDFVDNSLSLGTFTRGVVLLVCIVACLGVFVFVREKIYQNSRIYGELLSHKEVLLEEQKELKQKIESLQFQNNIMNYFEK